MAWGHVSVPGLEVASTYSATASFHLWSLSHARAIAQATGVWITDCAQSDVLYFRHMNKEKPAVISPRVYKRHRDIIKKAARKLRVSEAEVVRRALDDFLV
jgi:hypothetical protein